jgi:hypothetical protein
MRPACACMAPRASGLALNPVFSISRVRAIITSDHPTFLAGREHIYDGLRKAGAPDQ